MLARAGAWLAVIMVTATLTGIASAQTGPAPAAGAPAMQPAAPAPAAGAAATQPAPIAATAPPAPPPASGLTLPPQPPPVLAGPPNEQRGLLNG